MRACFGRNVRWLSPMRIKDACLAVATWVVMAIGLLGCAFGLLWIVVIMIWVETWNSRLWWTLLYLIPTALAFISVQAGLLWAILRNRLWKRRFVLARWSAYAGCLQSFVGIVLWVQVGSLAPPNLH